jgi:hypothetical protein
LHMRVYAWSANCENEAGGYSKTTVGIRKCINLHCRWI